MTETLTDAGIVVPDFLSDLPFEDNLEAPDIGSFKPRIYPGPVKFIFTPVPAVDRSTGQPTADGLSAIVVNGQTYYQLHFNADILAGTLPPARLVEPVPADTIISVRFQRVSTYVFPKRGISTACELYRSLGLDKKFGVPKTQKELLQRLVEAKGAVGHGDIGWEAYNSATKERFSTAPNTKKGDKPWPKQPDGRPALEVTFSDGTTKFGRERLTRLFRS